LFGRLLRADLCRKDWTSLRWTADLVCWCDLLRPIPAVLRMIRCSMCLPWLSLACVWP